MIYLLAAAGHSAGQAISDNSALIPKLQPDSEVQMEGMSPDWVKTLIMAELRIETATPEGTFAAATKVLDHYAEMGVNGLWIDPIWERGSKGNGYGNFGPASVEPLLTGKETPDESLDVVKAFVDEAHRRNIRIFFDIIVWGTRSDAPLVKEHPEFYKKVDGKFTAAWGGYGFDWNSGGLKDWYRDAAVHFIERTGADGFRVDLAPDISGYFFKQIRDALSDEGRKIAIISEMPGARKDTFDFEEVGVTGWTEEPNWTVPGAFEEQKRRFPVHNEYFLKSNIVDAIRTGAGIGNAQLQQQGMGGMFRFYTSNLLDHDDRTPFGAGSRVRFAYSSIFAPFIPLWWIGEEWNNPLKPGPGWDGAMYFNTIDWSALDANRAFYEDVKRYIRIRRALPDIFEQFPDSTRQANIAKVDSRVGGVPNALQAYGRFANGEAVLVVPNAGAARAHFDVTPSPAALGLDAALDYSVTDLMTGRPLPFTVGASAASFGVDIDGDHLGIYLLRRR